MDRTRPPATDPFAGIVAWIEQQLDRPLTLEQVAARAGLVALSLLAASERPDAVIAAWGDLLADRPKHARDVV